MSGAVERDRRWEIVAGAAILIFIGSPAARTDPSQADRQFEREIRPLLSRYCFRCHGPTRRKAKVNLSLARSEADMGRAQPLWLNVLKQLKTRVMPPEEQKQPAAAERAKIVAWLEAAMDRIDARAPRDPGRVTLHRLNRTEYDNTLRDLTGLDLNPADEFPLDDVTGGFDNNADALTLPPLLLEKYLDGADRILDKAVVTGEKVELLDRKIEAESLARRKEAAGGFAHLRQERELRTSIDVPKSGRYEIRVRAWQEKAPEGGAAVLALKLNGVDMALLRVTAEKGRPAEYAGTFAINPGPRNLSFRHTPPKAYKKGEERSKAELTLDWIRITGPQRFASHRRIFFVDPGKGAPAERAAAKRILERFASRAFRRPVPPAEVERYLKLYDAGRRQGKDYVNAVRLSLLSVLVSPHFLFRVERDSLNRDASGAVALNDWEMASRLSYFLWSTMPDDTLFDLAAKGKLKDPEVLAAQARRMLAGPKSEAFVENFAGQWLGLRKLDRLQPDRELFPGFSEALRRAMIDETSLFFANVARGDGSILDLVDADYTFVNQPLARHYGIRNIKGGRMRRVKLENPNRGGVMTMASVLTITSHPTRTSAVKRGKWILEEILGAPPPPPPPNVPALEEATKNRPDAASLTLRKQLEIHREDPKCSNCHKRMDVLGLGMENFDPIGRWRDREGKNKIDPSGTLPTGEVFSTPSQLKKILAKRKDEFARALTEKVFSYALGRSLERYDRREVRRVVEGLRRNGYRFSALIEGVVTSTPFRYRRAAR